VSYRTPEELRDVLLRAPCSPEIVPFVKALKSAGSFSNRFAGLVDRMQHDETFRRRVLSDALQVAQHNLLQPHETFFLLVAANILDADYPWPTLPNLTLAPTPQSMAQRFSRQRADAEHINSDRVNNLMTMISKDVKFAKLVLQRPSLALGPFNLTQVEFSAVVAFAMLHPNARDGDTVLISEECATLLASANKALSSASKPSLLSRIINAPRTLFQKLGCLFR
jgi:hypothetical protein